MIALAEFNTVTQWIQQMKLFCPTPIWERTSSLSRIKLFFIFVKAPWKDLHYNMFHSWDVHSPVRKGSCGVLSQFYLPWSHVQVHWQSFSTFIEHFLMRQRQYESTAHRMRTLSSPRAMLVVFLEGIPQRTPGEK